MDVLASSIPHRATAKSRFWRELLGALVELVQEAPTRCDSRRLIEARLDRLYCSLPGWALLSLHSRF
eukprot:7096161-Karenia_brevis.AAC.1